MSKETNVIKEEVLLKITKEIMVKFIEMGKVSPASFDETFKAVYETVRDASSKERGK